MEAMTNQDHRHAIWNRINKLVPTNEELAEFADELDQRRNAPYSRIIFGTSWTIAVDRTRWLFCSLCGAAFPAGVVEAPLNGAPLDHHVEWHNRLYREGAGK